MVPVKYNLRNLRARWVTTAMTAMGTGLVVWASVLSFGLADGLENALQISADSLDLIVLRKGSLDEPSSLIDKPTADSLKTLDGLARDAQGRPLCSEELVITLMKPRRGDGGTTNLIVRGLSEAGHALRPDFRLVGGRVPQPGKNEAMTSRRLGERFLNAGLGEKLKINNVEFEIVGYFEAAGSVAESEVWTDVRDLATVRKTPGFVTSINLRAQDESSKRALIQRIEQDEQFNLRAVTEQEYFKDQMLSATAIRVIGYFIAGFLTAGAMFGAANTMYAAVAGRAREIGTLRVLGFSLSSILLSFLLESILLCLLGGMLGCLGILPFHGYSTGTANLATFSEVTFSFNFGPAVLLRGMFMALSMGLVGGMLPAIRAARLNLVQSLREI